LSYRLAVIVTCRGSKNLRDVLVKHGHDNGAAPSTGSSANQSRRQRN
jgi:hypothetical protein